ncbi:hypothetical protein N9L99_00400 [Aquiluna sp.]|nr:hypothetical protein [Aquiluna sp.]
MPLPEPYGLLDQHLRRHSQADHINRPGLTIAIRELSLKPALILETGSSAWGTDSSKLFDSYVNSFGGEFHTVDIRQEAADLLRGRIGGNSQTHVGDSVSFLEQFTLASSFDQVSLVYLDSFDLDSASPEPAMAHGLAEFMAVQRLLGPGSIVVVDDTPVDASLLGAQGLNYWSQHHIIPGKGALILCSPLIGEFEILYHHYNLVLRKL